jgi:sec-independent protein translocase protein TatA
MFDVGGPEVMLILFIFLLLFGANKMPEVARGIGKSIREFKKAASGVEEEVRRALEEEPAKPAPKPAGTIQQPPSETPSPPPAAD